MWLNQGFGIFFAQSLFFIQIAICTSQKGSFVQYLKHITSKTNVLPEIRFTNGYFIDIERSVEINLNFTNIIHFTEKEILDETFYQRGKVRGYKIIHLHNTAGTWNVNQLEEFTLIMNKCQTVHNILGFVININTMNLTNHSLPFIKVAVHDIKVNLRKKRMHNKFVGFYIEESVLDPFFMEKQSLTYLQCSNNMPPDLIISKTGFQMLETINEECEDLSSELQQLEINLSALPYSPRPGRCDCIVTSLYCYSNPGTSINWNTNLTLRHKICDEIDCSSVENDPKTGHYGIFGGCTEAQKNSIVLNLYYTYHGMDPKYCNHSGLAQIRDSEPRASAFRDIIDTAGIRCGDEIPEDWTKYVVGVRKPAVKPNTTISKDLIYEQEMPALNNAAIQGSTLTNKLLTITIIVMTALYMLNTHGFRQFFITVYI